jgi:RNA polymerase sigma factor (sigma-70 family)
MSQIMSELELIGLVRSFLAKLEAEATREEALAFEELYREYGRIMRRMLGGKHRGWTDDDDLFQVGWIIFVHRLKTLDFDPARDTLAGWISKIVRDVVGRHIHRFSKRREQELTPDVADELFDLEYARDREVSGMELREELGNLIENLRPRLSERDHGIVVKRWLEGRSVLEITGELKLTRDCVNAVLHRVARKLRNRCGEEDWSRPRGDSYENGKLSGQL